jgi:hypothetical protein
MPVRKFSLSVAADVMAQVDKAAAERGLARSRFVADVWQGLRLLLEPDECSCIGHDIGEGRPRPSFHCEPLR